MRFYKNYVKTKADNKNRKEKLHQMKCFYFSKKCAKLKERSLDGR